MLLCHYRQDTLQSLAAFSKQSASEILVNSSGMNGTFLFLSAIIKNTENLLQTTLLFSKHNAIKTRKSLYHQRCCYSLRLELLSSTPVFSVKETICRKQFDRDFASGNYGLMSNTRTKSTGNNQKSRQVQHCKLLIQTDKTRIEVKILSSKLIEVPRSIASDFIYLIYRKTFDLLYDIFDVTATVTTIFSNIGLAS